MRMNPCLGVLLALIAPAVLAATKLPAPVQALEKHGLKISGEMPAPPGFKGYLAEFQGKSLPVYLLPDGKHVVVGNLFDATGKDLTSEPYAKAVRPRLDAAAWKALGNSTWIAEGTRHPKHVVYVISDTECTYCHQLWQKIQPMLKGGTVQVRFVLVAVISHNSLGRAAAILSAPDPAAALRRHEDNYGHSPYKPMQTIPPELREKVQSNIALMNQLGATGTPAIYFHDGQGKLHMLDGMPNDDALIRSIFGA